MDFTLQSGAKLVVSEAAFEDADALMNALLESNLGIELKADIMNQDVTALKDAVIKAKTSKAFDEAFWKCARKAVYENTPVAKGLFDDPKLGAQARKDYFLIVWHVVEVNLRPFFEQTFSALSGLLKTTSLFQKSGSPPAEVKP